MIEPTAEEILAYRAEHEPIIARLKALLVQTEADRDLISVNKKTCDCCGRENYEDWNRWLARQHMNAALNSIAKTIEKLEKPPCNQWEDRREKRQKEMEER